jgi:hypothetical protein
MDDFWVVLVVILAWNLLECREGGECSSVRERVFERERECR